MAQVTQETRQPKASAYDQVHLEISASMLACPKKIRWSTHLMWVAHHLERIADRATDIGEWVTDLVTRELTEINVST